MFFVQKDCFEVIHRVQQVHGWQSMGLEDAIRFVAEVDEMRSLTHVVVTKQDNNLDRTDDTDSSERPGQVKH